MAGGKPDPMDAAHQVIVLAFDLADAEFAHLPGQITQALQSPPVQDAIRKTLLDFAKTKGAPGAAPVTNADAQKLLEALGTGIKSAGTDALLQQIKKTPEYKKLEASIEGFKNAASSSSLGVWVDKNKNILYVVGAALIVGTATVLYVTKSGGGIVSMGVDPLKNKEFEVLQIGSLKIKAGLWDFQPDARILGARVSLVKTWEKLSLDFKLGVLAQETHVKQVDGSAVVKSGPFSVSLTGSGKPEEHQVNLGLKLGYEGVLGNGKFNIGIGALYKDEALSGTLGASYQTRTATLGLQGNIGPDKGGRVQYGGLLTLTIPL